MFEALRNVLLGPDGTPCGMRGYVAVRVLGCNRDVAHIEIQLVADDGRALVEWGPFSVQPGGAVHLAGIRIDVDLKMTGDVPDTPLTVRKRG